MSVKLTTGLTTAVAVTLFHAAAAFAQNPVLASQDSIQRAIAAWQAEDFETAAEALEQARAQNPESLFTRFSLARAYARLERRDDALTILEGLAKQRIDMGVSEQADFEVFAGDPRYQAFADNLAEATQPVLASEPHFELRELGLIPEGIAYDADTGRLFFSSMRTGSIFVLDDAGQVSRFADIGEPGMSAIGVTVDRERGLLWVAAAAYPIAEDFVAGATTGSALVGIELDGGAIRHTLRWHGEDSNFNDVTVAPDGSVYVSGTGVFVVRDNPARLAPLAGGIDIFGGNGLTVHPDGKTLFVSSYPAGLYAVTLPEGDTVRMTAPDDLSLYGIDGLYWHDGALIAVQNGALPWRLMRLAVSDDRRRIESSEILELGNPATAPMTGAIVDDVIYYIGEGEQPAELPAHFPDHLRGNAGPIVIRKAAL